MYGSETSPQKGLKKAFISGRRLFLCVSVFTNIYPPFSTNTSRYYIWFILNDAANFSQIFQETSNFTPFPFYHEYQYINLSEPQIYLELKLSSHMRSFN